MIGVSVWGLEASDRAWYGGPRTFAEAFGEKYYRVEKFDKPVIIAELIRIAVRPWLAFQVELCLEHMKQAENDEREERHEKCDLPEP